MKAPISWNRFNKIVNNIIKENEYIDKCAKLNINIFENLHNETSLVDLIDYLFTPESSSENYDTFSWWLYESNYGKEELSYWDGDEGENEHKIKNTEDIYKLLCKEKECDCIIEEINATGSN